jgi:hypothetical protein
MRPRTSWQRTACLLLPLLLAAAPALAIRDWYHHYLDARDRLIPGQRWDEAIQNLREAQKLKPGSALNEQSYGLQIFDYFPYYYQGLCHLRQGDAPAAILMFNIEERQGFIKQRTELYRELLRMRGEAETARAETEKAESQRKARVVREEVDRLRREATELERAGKLDDALARLVQAQKAAEVLDSATQREVLDQIARLRGAAEAAAQASALAQRIEQDLVEGRRLLEEGRHAEARVRFDDVLGRDARNARALVGRREAEEGILATTTRQARAAAFQEGQRLFEAGRYEDALRPLGEAAADPGNSAARQLLERAHALLENLRREREARTQVEQLMVEAEGLAAQGKHAEAWVRLDKVLALDAANPKARKLLETAQRRTGERILDQILPNRGPALTFWEPPATEVFAPFVALAGVASDDRGVAVVEVSAGGKVLSEQTASGEQDAPQLVRFSREVPLVPGVNEVTVTAIDTSGVRQVETFRVSRHLRFWESALFVPLLSGGLLALCGGSFGLVRWRRRRAIVRRFNPYIAGAPVLEDEMFFGRRKLLSRILSVLDHNSLMITGERRIGKTTLLYHLKKALEQDTGSEYQFFPVFVDLQGVPESAFFHTLMNEVVDALRFAPATLESLRFRPEQEDYDGRDFSHDLQKVLAELHGRTQRKAKLALLIDEVDVLNEYSERVNQRLRSIFMKTFSEHIVAIMSGVGIRRTWKSEGSPWYNFFDELEVKALSREEAEALVREPVKGFFRYEEAAVQRILEVSQLKPYVIQKLCIRALGRMLEEGRSRVAVADVEAALETLQTDDLPAAGSEGSVGNS